MTKLFALAAALAACNLLSGDFRLSGSVSLDENIEDRLPKTGAVLFIIAENEGDVPIAVQRVMDPTFPVSFRMGPTDLIVPALISGQRLHVRAEVSTHGQAGKLRPGDLFGQSRRVIFPGSSGVRVTIDQIR